MAKVYYMSPPGITKYTHIVEPDTEGQYATGKHTTKLIMTPEEAVPLIAEITKVVANHKAGENCKIPYKNDTIKVGSIEKETGNIRFSMSSKFAPLIVGPNNKPIKVKKMSPDFDIGDGSRVRVTGEIYSYDKGVSLQISQVQLLDLVKRQSMFDAQDGTFDGSEYESDEDDNEVSGSFTNSNKEALGI